MTARVLLAAALVAALVGAPAFAQTSDAPPAQAAPAPDHPWVKDKALIDATMADVQANGILAVRAHVDDLETALAGARHAFDVAAAGDGDTKYVLTDGPANTLMALLLATTDKSHKSGQTVAEPNPYPTIAFYLGSYYDEIGKPDEARRVLEIGLALPGSETVSLRPSMLIEHGAALGALKLWTESLASYDEGLKISGLDPETQAFMYRGRGFALIELHRLDDAQESYAQSLKLQPGNDHAQHELDYIAGLRKGAMPTATSLAPVQAPAAPADTH